MYVSAYSYIIRVYSYTMCPQTTKSASRLLSRASLLQLSHMRPLWHTCSNLGYRVTNLLCLSVLPALRTHRYEDTCIAVSACMHRLCTASHPPYAFMYIYTCFC